MMDEKCFVMFGRWQLVLADRVLVVVENTSLTFLLNIPHPWVKVRRWRLGIDGDAGGGLAGSTGLATKV